MRALALLILLFSCTPIQAQSMASVYVATTGSDTNVCTSPLTPCLTCQAALNQAADRANLYFAAGTYAGCNIVGYVHRFIGVWGLVDSNYTCINPASVVLTNPGDAAIWVQDIGVGIVKCLTITNSAIGVAGRQHVIVDIDPNVYFTASVSLPVTGADFAIINCGAKNWPGSGPFGTQVDSKLNGC